MKKTIRDVDLRGKKVLVRCDFNVPLEDGKIKDDNRIESAIPTIKYLIKQGARIILMSHLGRPKGEAKKEFSLEVVAKDLSKKLGREVLFAQSDVVVDDSVRKLADCLKDGQVMLLENVRFRAEETKNDPAFSKELASLGEIFVQDAFGTAHRAHSSTAGIADYLPAYSGFLIEKEVKFLEDAVNNPERPFVAIMGGSKVSDKIKVIENLLSKVDTLIIGGGMAYTFFKAQGMEIGKSILDENGIELAKNLISLAREKDVDLVLPIDVVCADAFSDDANNKVCLATDIPKDYMGLDIGPRSIENFVDIISEARTVIWNGPVGVFEMKSYENGTRSLAEALAKSDATTIIGGGDSAAAVKQFGLEKAMTHISTGGGASLEYLEGKVLPGIAIIEDK